MAKRILKPLSYTGLLDEAFDLYKSHFFLLVGIAAVMSVPVSIVTYFTGNIIAVCLLLTPFYLLEFAAVTWAISQCYLGRAVGIVDSYKAIFKGFFSLVMSLLLAVAIIYIGFAMLVVPGIVVSFWLFFTLPAIVIENERYIDAINRSRWLAVGNWGRIFVIGILTFLVCGTLRVIISIPTKLILAWLETNVKLPLALGLLYEVVDGLLSSVFTAIPVITLVLLYYDIRVRREGFDIEMLARDLDSEQEVAVT